MAIHRLQRTAEWPIVPFHIPVFGFSLTTYAAKQKEVYGYVSDSMMVSIFLQFIYVATFFYYEEGYFFTMDIQHDRAGFYLCWGCLLWVPCVYTSPSMYLVYHPNNLGMYVSIGLILMGLACFCRSRRGLEYLVMTSSQCFSLHWFFN